MSNHLTPMHKPDIDYQAYRTCSFYHEFHDKQARINFFKNNVYLSTYNERESQFCYNESHANLNLGITLLFIDYISFVSRNLRE